MQTPSTTGIHRYSVRLRHLAECAAMVTLLSVTVGCGVSEAPRTESHQPVANVSSPANVSTYVSFPHSGGPARNDSKPTLTVSLNTPGLSEQSITTQVSLKIGVVGDKTDTVIGPIVVDIQNGNSNSYTYKQSYSVTDHKSTLTIPQQTLTVHIPVPSQSGEYRVQAHVLSASGSQDALPAKPIVLYVDHGGFYRTGTISSHTKLVHGDFEVDVTGVTMTRDNTQIHYILRALHHTSGAWGDGEGGVTMSVKNADGTIIQVISAQGDTRGAVKDNTLDCVKYVDPTWSNALSLTIHFNHVSFDSGNGFVEDSGSFSVTVPLTQSK